MEPIFVASRFSCVAPLSLRWSQVGSLLGAGLVESFKQRPDFVLFHLGLNFNKGPFGGHHLGCS